MVQKGDGVMRSKAEIQDALEELNFVAADPLQELSQRLMIVVLQWVTGSGEGNDHMQNLLRDFRNLRKARTN